MLLTADWNKHKDQKMYLPQMFWTVKLFLPWFQQIRPIKGQGIWVTQVKKLDSKYMYQYVSS